MTTRTLVGSTIALIIAIAIIPVHAAAIGLEPVLTGLTDPLFVTNAGDSRDRLFVVERAGVIKVLQPGSTSPTVFLDITARVRSGGERGLLGLAFHPQFLSNRRFFVDYTRQTDGATVIAEYQASVGDPDIADLTEKVLLVIAQPNSSHKGGMVAFGSDGFLYIAMGDGGDANDPDNRAQDINELLGKILRIDVDPPDGSQVPYSSPPSNPFFGSTPGRDEIFAIGMRNPWRFSFDRGTGHLYVGDVGQDAFEEIDIVTLGGNYGWRVREGKHCTGLGPAPCNTSGFTDPIIEYAHSSTPERCSVTGGYVYRGSRATLPTGTYLFSDFCSGEIFQLPGGTSSFSVLLDTSLRIVSFGEDESGEIYVVSLFSSGPSSGTVHRITREPVCTFSVSPTSRSVPPVGVQGAIAAVTAPAGCNWTAVENATWITITSDQTSSGNGDVVFDVAPNFGSATSRTGTLTIGGQTFTVTQAGCTLSVSPTTRSVPVGGVAGAVAGVSAPAGCPWTAASNDQWIRVTSSSSGSGNGQVAFSVDPNFASTSARMGTLTIAGRTFTVAQAGCIFSLGPTSRSVPVAGITNATTGLSAPPGCAWTAASNDPWITITSSPSGSGNAQVAFSVASNFASATARTGTLTIASRTFTVTQAGCTYSLGPTSRSVPVAGIPSAVTGVSAPAGCGWTAARNDPWIAITSSPSGSGNGQVAFSVASNVASTSARTGTLTIAGRTFTVTQAGCTYSLSATGRSVAAGGVQGAAVAVGAPAGCGWTMVSHESWIIITSGPSGTGNGQVVFSVASNQATTPRTGTLTIPGRTFTVTQAAGASSP
jgi:glucose/arabinose dehydrogenase